MKSDRIPVPVDSNMHLQLKAYSDLTGVPIARVVREAVSDWLSTTGQARMETLTQEPNEA